MEPAVRSLLCILALGMLLAWPSADAAAVLDPRLEAAERLYREEGADRALPVFEQLAGEFARDSRRQDHAAALHYVGECRWRLGDFTQARQYLDRALALERAADDRLSQGRTLNVLGLLSWDEGNYQRAIADFRQAGELARTGKDRKLEGASLNNLSLVYDEQGDYDTSLQQYQRVLELYRGADFLRGVGDTLGNIGGVHLLLGRFRQALDYYQQALAISEQLNSTTSMSQDHGNIALSLLGLGEIDAALLHLDKAIGLATQAGMQQDQAYWLRVKAGGLVEKGRYDLGLQNYRDALVIYERVGARAELVAALHGFGQLHLLLGDSSSAERDFRRALELAQSIGHDRGVTMSFIWLGDIEFRRGQTEPAAALYQQARQRAATADMKHVLALSLLRLARVDRSLQRLAPAIAETDQALALSREIGASSLEAEALYSRAEAARMQRRYADALVDYRSAEEAGTGLVDPDLLWQLRFGRARAQEGIGDVPAAIGSLEAAIDLIEGVRGRLQEPRFRSGYAEDKFEVYLELMRLQLQQGGTADAFSTAERLRARSFVEQLGGRASIPLTASERRTEAELRERVRRLNQVLDETDDDGSSAYPARAINRFSQELLVAEREYATFIDNRARVAPKVDLVTRVSSIQHRLARDEALLEYVVAPESLIVFVLTSRDIAVKSLPVRETDLVARIALLRDLVGHPGDDRWRKPAARLWTQLIEPIEAAGWLDGVSRLQVVPHGALSYLPFALLPRSGKGPEELLVDRYTVSYLPAATALLRAPSGATAAGSLLVVAPSRSGLRHAPEEARTIGAMFQPHSQALIGGDATEGRFKEIAGGFRMLHLATHGHFNEANPVLSGLEFVDPDDDGMLRVHEILDLQLRADLVTLSACDTALGTGHFTRLPRGDEFIGLNRAFLAAGSASVMATLWRVDDRASLLMMKQFYRRLNESHDGSGAAGALAYAQRAHRRSGALGHPYYWAAYVVVGQGSQAMGAGGMYSGRRS